MLVVTRRCVCAVTLPLFCHRVSRQTSDKQTRRSALQALRGGRPRRQLVPEVDGVLRPAHQQVEHVRAHVEEAGGSGRGHVQQLSVRRGRTRRARLQPLLAALRLCGEVSRAHTQHVTCQSKRCRVRCGLAVATF